MSDAIDLIMVRCLACEPNFHACDPSALASASASAYAMLCASSLLLSMPGLPEAPGIFTVDVAVFAQAPASLPAPTHRILTPRTRCRESAVQVAQLCANPHNIQSGRPDLSTVLSALAALPVRCVQLMRYRAACSVSALSLLVVPLQFPSFESMR
jgi:hypothetical protein